MKQLKVLSAIGLLAVAGVAQAEVTSSIAITSDYDFRGFTQTGESPALQLSLDFATDFGLYAGIWGSNVDQFSDGGLNTASTEVDAYVGFSGEAGAFGWDAGLVYYTYEGASDLNFAELYGKFSISIVSFGVYFSNDFGGKATGDSGDSALYGYVDLGIPAGPISIDLHAGLSSGDGIEAAYGVPGEDSYTDFAVGLSYSASNFTTGIKYTAYDFGDGGSDGRIVLTVSTSLPWGE